MIVGGYNSNSLTTSERILLNDSSCNPPSLPIGISGQPSLVFTDNNETLICGGYNNQQKCLELEENQWQEHSALKNPRRYASSVSLSSGVFIFGGVDSSTTWEWLPSEGPTEWISGTNNIPGFGLREACAVRASTGVRIILIGGYGTNRRVLKFDSITKQFTNLGDEILKQGRWLHACTYFEGLIIIAGGFNAGSYISSTEVINAYDLATANINFGSMVQARAYHGLTVVHIDGSTKILALGGYANGNYLDSIEILDPTSAAWKMTSMKLSEKKREFGLIVVAPPPTGKQPMNKMILVLWFTVHP